jgi:hypothetical protein
METDNPPGTLDSYEADLRRATRSAIIWLLIGLTIGLVSGYLLHALRNDDVEQRYNDHLMEEHSGKHKPV